MTEPMLIGVMLCMFGAGVATYNALVTLYRGAKTPEEKLGYIDGYVCASFFILAGIAAFVFDIVLKLNG